MLKNPPWSNQTGRNRCASSPKAATTRVVNVLRVLAFALLALPLLLGSPAASAQGTTCETQLTDLRAAIDAATLSAKTRTGLLGKLDAAELKLEQGKTADAGQKLTDLKNSVIAQRDAGKISPKDAQAIIDAADAAIGCISPSTS